MNRRDLLKSASALALMVAAPSADAKLRMHGFTAGGGGGGGGAFRAWTPLDLGTPLKMWIDPNVAGSITLNGSNVATITDLSGTGNDATATVGAQPAYAATGINSKGAMQFSSGKSLSSALANGVASPRTTVMLFNNTNSGANRAIFAGNGPSGLEVRLNTTNGWDFLLQGVTFEIASSNPFPVGLCLLVFAFDGSNMIVRVNGAFTDIFAIGAITPTARSTTIGSAAGAENFDSFMGPVLAIDATLSEDVMEKIEGYLLWEYGLQSMLPASHVYKAAAPTIAPLDASYKFATNRTKQPLQTITVGSTNPFTASSQVYYTPGYAQTDPRICIPNFQTPQTGNSPFEIDCGAGRVIEGVSIKMAGVWYPMLSTGRTALVATASSVGATSHTFATGEAYIWFEKTGITLPASSSFEVIIADHTPIGQLRPIGLNPIVGTYGDLGDQSTSTMSAFLTGGTVPTPPFGLLCPSPIAIVAKGTPGGQPVVLEIGDSIGDGALTNVSQQSGRANSGYIPIGLDDNTAGVGRFASGHFCVGATSFFSITPFQFIWRHQILKDVGFPFTTIICEHLNNNVGGGTAGIESAAGASWTYMKTWERKKIIQTFVNPLTADVSNDKWSTTANQTTVASNAFPSGERWAMVAFIKTTPAPIDAYIDVTPYWVTGGDKWLPPGRNSVLAANVSSGQVISVTGTPPRVGDDIVIGAGSGSPAPIVRNVGSVTGTGPFTVTFTFAEPAVTGSFLAGAAVKAAASLDGIHPCTCMHQDASAAIIAAKVAGMFV